MANHRPRARNRRPADRAVCPVCQAPVQAADPEFPFCGRRCKLIDLGKWFDGERRISTPMEEEDE